MYDQLLNLFGDVHPFLRDNRDLAPSTQSKLLNILDDSQKNVKLQLELAAVVDAGAQGHLSFGRRFCTSAHFI